MIQAHDDYHFVGGDDFHEIIVNGGIMPLRSNPMTLRGEDIVFLQEAFIERQLASGDMMDAAEPTQKLNFTRDISAAQFNNIIRNFSNFEDDRHFIDGGKLSTLKFDHIPSGSLSEIAGAARSGALDLPAEVSPGDKCRASAVLQLLAAANATKWVEAPINYSIPNRQGKVTGEVYPEASTVLSGGIFSQRIFNTNAMRIEYGDAGVIKSVGDYKTLGDFLLDDRGEAIYLQLGNPWFYQRQYLEVWGLLSARRERHVTYPPMYSSGGLPPYQPAEHSGATSCKLVRLTSGSSDYSGYRWVVGTSTLKSHFDELEADVGFSRSIPSMAQSVSDQVNCQVEKFFFALRLDLH